MSNRTQKSTDSKARPEKPAGFPLYPHASGQWAKTIKGKKIYFGPWDDRDGALAELDSRFPHLVPDGIEVPKKEGATVDDLCQKFLDRVEDRIKQKTRKLKPGTYRQYLTTCKRLVRYFGRDKLLSEIQPSDFEKLRTNLEAPKGKKEGEGGYDLSPSTMAAEINRIKTIFNFGFKCHPRLLKEPMSYSFYLEAPTADELDAWKDKGGEKKFSREEVLQIAETANPHIRGMVLLAINTAYTQADIAELTIEMVKEALETGWIELPRVKTNRRRRCPLWPETVDAVRLAGEHRPKPANEEAKDYYFLTKQGNQLVRTRPLPTGKYSSSDGLFGPFKLILDKLGINGRRSLGFSAFRHTFATQGGNSIDQAAVKLIMGHKDTSITAVYQHGIDDNRLLAVSNHVRSWLFGEGVDG